MNFVVAPADLQLVVVIFVAVQWWALSQYSERHHYFRFWAVGWAWLVALILMSRLAVTLQGDTGLGDALRVGIAIAGLLQLYYFALGALQLTPRQALSRQSMRTGAAIVAGLGLVIGLASVIAANELRFGLAMRVGLRDLGLGVVFVYSAWQLFGDRRAAQTVAYGVTSSALLLFGLHQFYYAVGDVSTLVEFAGWEALVPYDSLAILHPVNWAIDMLLTGAVGLGAVLLLNDEARRAERDVQRREAEFRGIFERAPIGIAVLDDFGRIVQANQSLADLLEQPTLTLQEQVLATYLHGNALDFAGVLSTGQPRRHQIVLTSSSGRRVRCLIDLISLAGPDRARRVVAQFLDVTDQHNLQERLSHLAMHDSVTGLPNRAYLEEHLHAAVKRMQRRTTPLVVMFVDLNAFKPVNDTYGHAAGDRVLQVVARRIADSVREGDFVGRYGGDEFALVLEECPLAECAEIVARRVANAVAQPLRIDGIELIPSASVGVVISNVRDEAHDLLAGADAAMYRAKRSGLIDPVIVDRSERLNVAIPELRG